MAYQQDNETSTTSQPDNIISDTIEVTGEDVSNTEVLEVYFLSINSGGKREKEVEWIKVVDEGVVHVKFLSSEDAAAVIAQERHTLMRKPLYVRYVPAPPPEVPKQYQKDKLFIRDIPEGVDCDFLIVFIEGRLAIENENDFTLDFRSDCALLLFTHMYTDEELTAMINKLTSKKAKKSQLTVERCEVNCSIYVNNITNKAFTTVDALEMYFDNSRSGAGEGTIESVEMLTKDKAKIKFKDPSVILRVLEKKHERLGPNVSITECTVLDSSTLSKADITIPPETADTVYPMIMKFCNEGGLQYAFSQGGNKLSIAGDIGLVTKLQNDVQELCSRLIKKEEVITLNPEDYCFLKELMLPLIQKQHPSITFQCNDQHLALSVNGSIKDVGEFQDKINHYLVHSKAPVNLQPLAVKFLQEGAGRQVLQNMTKGSKVVPYFANKENQTCLLLLSRNEHAFLVETVAARIQQEVCVKTDNLPQSFQSRVAESTKYAAFQDALSKKHPFLATVYRNQLIIVSTSTSIGEVSQSFKSFIAEECSITKDLRLKRGVWRLFHATSMEKKWTDLVSGMRENGVTIVSFSKPTAQKLFLRIKGNIINVERAAEKIQELQCAVKERQIQISRPGICRYFYNDPNGQMVLKGIENEAQVSIEMGVDDDEADNVSKPSQETSQFTRICFGTTSGLKTITIFVGDITEFNRAEVIVNTANEDLKHIGGLALAIAKKGGPIIQQESDDYVQLKGKVSTGKAVLFQKVGNLPYKAIVHAVGPRWAYGGNHEREIALLKKAIRTSLSKARDYTSIALPAISSGLHGFPIDVCANALVQAAVEFSKSDPDSNISEINFVVLQDIADVFLAAAKKHMENVRTLQHPPAARYIYKGAAAIRSLFGYGEEEEYGWDEVKSEGQNEKDHEDDEDFNTARMLSNLSLDSKVILHIYGETEHSVMRAEKRLRAIIDIQFISEDVIDEKIIGLSDFTTRELESLAKDHNVDIDIDRDPAIYTIKLHGCHQDVLFVKDKVRDAMSALTQKESKKVAADVVYKTIRWKRMLSNEEEEEYDEDLNFEIEQAYQKKDNIFKCEEDDFYIDFTKMEEKDTVTDKVVKVKRMDSKKVANNVPTHKTPLLHRDLQEKEREIQHLTQQLTAVHSELQQTRQQQIEITTALQEDLQRQEEKYKVSLRQLHQKLQVSEQMQTALQKEHNKKQKDFNQQLQAAEIQLRQELQQSQQAQAILQQQNEDINHQLQEATTALQQSQQDNVLLQQQLQQHQSETTDQDKQGDLHWVIRKEEIIMTERVLGKGGYGEVKVAMFRGLEVAAKCLHDIILSPYNLRVFTREMEIAARVRHPNLLQFIGATREGTAIILSELMPMSLRKKLEKSPLTRNQIVKIGKDVALALNYLHLWKPHPILHRDVSSPNVLLEPCGGGQWKAKLSDYGSANIIHNISASSVYPGNPFYSAPEAEFPIHHSPAMDVYSFGVLLMEMILCEPPSSTPAEREHQVETIQWQSLKPLVQRCILRDCHNRLTSGDIVTELQGINKVN